jgi:hypothetical protein
MAATIARVFSALYGVMGLMALVAPHMLFSTFASFPSTVDKMGWYYLEPLVRCSGLMSLGLSMALYCIGHTAQTTSDQSISKCSCTTVAAILATRGIGDAVLAYMYPELRTFATYGLIIAHHAAVVAEGMCMMKTMATTAKEKTQAATGKKE